VFDQIYGSNPIFYRLYRSNKKTVRGGTQIEVPLLYARNTAAGNFTGFDLLDTTPTDKVKNAAYDWKQKYVSVTIDGTTLLKNDSPESAANILNLEWQAARMEMEDRLGTGIFSDAVTDAKEIDGVQGAIDNGTVAATYGGLGARTTTNAFWQPRAGGLDTTTATLTLNAMQAVFGSVTSGARHPTLIVTTQNNYNRFQSLLQVQQRFPSEPTGRDEQLAQAGFTNLLYNNVPMVVDDHVNTTRAGTAGDHMYFFNEDFMELVCHPGRDMVFVDFVKPANQDAFVGQLLTMMNLVFTNIRLQGLMTALAA
jgi:hypothetical protein